MFHSLTQLATRTIDNLEKKDAQQELANIGKLAIHIALANSSIEEVRKILVQNKKLCEETGTLTKYNTTPTQIRLGESAYLNTALQKQFTETENADLLVSLAKAPTLNQEAIDLLIELGPSDKDFREELAKNNEVPHLLQMRLANDDEQCVREALAANPALTEAAQYKLATDDKRIRVILATNPSLSLTLQAELAEDSDIDIRLALMDNPSLGPCLRSQIIEKLSQAELTIAEQETERARDHWNDLIKETNSLSSHLLDSLLIIDIPFINPPERKERLDQEAQQAWQRLEEAEREYGKQAERRNKISEILRSR